MNSCLSLKNITLLAKNMYLMSEFKKRIENKDRQVTIIKMQKRENALLKIFEYLKF